MELELRQHRQPTTGGKPLLNPRGLNDRTKGKYPNY
nr:MAG TPA: hypothetical protein [Caudoviricetes sp.]